MEEGGLNTTPKVLTKHPRALKKYSEKVEG
jgi:hypothetical protein